jgi:hypothetical protein
MSASLYEFRDLDLMMTLAAEGELTSGEIAQKLGVDTHGVAVRSSWMRRFGMFEFDELRKVWTLSAGGQRVVQAKRRAALLQSVEDVPEESLVDIMSHVTARYRLGDPMTGHMLRREFAYGTARISRAWR